MSQIEAIPTEYKKIVFDSKSEAIFARCLDLAGQKWQYHPGKILGHNWDFLIFPSVREQKLEWLILGDRYISAEGVDTNAVTPPFLIEYKPKQPTSTYVQRLMRGLQAKPCNSFLVWGSPYNGVNEQTGTTYVPFPLFASFSDSGFLDRCSQAPAQYVRDGFIGKFHTQSGILGISELHVQEARRYRFDLEDSIEPAEHFIKMVNEESYTKISQASLLYSQGNLLDVWKLVASSVGGMLGDFAMLVGFVIEQNDEWTVFFHKGLYKGPEYCGRNENRLILQNALSKALGKNVSIKFTVA